MNTRALILAAAAIGIGWWWYRRRVPAGNVSVGQPTTDGGDTGTETPRPDAGVGAHDEMADLD